MRIAFMGKGGSGKTSLAAGYIRYLSRNSAHVLAIDSDVNAHLGEALGIEGQPTFLAKRFEQIAQHLEGNSETFRPYGISPIPCFGTVPPSQHTVFIRPVAHDSFLRGYAQQTELLSLLTVGPHDTEDFSNSCYHFNLNGLELILHRVLDGSDDRVITDAAAGTDSLGTSLFMAHDLSIMAVEPTEQSARVFLDYAARVRPLGISLRYVANKIRSGLDLAFLQRQLQGEEPLAVFRASSHLRAFEQGDTAAADRFVDAEFDAFARIETAVRAQQKDWDGYYRRLTELYDAECKRWWNGYYGRDLTGHYDSGFRYPIAVTVDLQEQAAA